MKATPSRTRKAGRVTRHALPDRLYHWTMAASVLVLLGTSFFPIFGYKFPWLTPHWIAGLVLTVAVLFHVVRASFWQGLRSMAVGGRDLRNAWSAVRAELGRPGPKPEKPGKYPLPQKLYHHIVAAVVLVTVVSGLLMMVRIDTPLWVRNPYWLPDHIWGVIFVLHGLGAMMLLSLVMVHVYFAVRPEKLWITRSMVLGWITRKEFLDHHDPGRWEPEQRSGPQPGDAANAAPGTAGTSAKP